MPRGPRGGHAWRQACTYIYTTQTHCWLCGLQVDLTLPYRDPDTNKVNTWSKSVDHMDPIIFGGDPLNRSRLRLAHLHCNCSRGADRKPTTAPPSRNW